MKKSKYIWLFYLLFWGLFSCSVPAIKEYEEEGTYPDIFPDYVNVTIPYNVAPLNFRIKQPIDQGILCLDGNESSFKISSKEGKFIIPARKWKKLLEKNKGGEITLTVFLKEKVWKRYIPFKIYISSDLIDPFLVYRLIEPGYELWDKMGIYQRSLENFRESSVFENKMTNYNCINCHSFCMQNPEDMMFHMRGRNDGTILLKNGQIEKLNTKTDSTISSLVYPCWHPSGKLIAFSVNKIYQVFYQNHQNRIEVYDSESDIVMYDTEKREVFTSPLLSSKSSLETFPGFSPDGKTLYFCSSDSFPASKISESVKYNLLSISFSPEKQTFGEKIDTIFNSRYTAKSASFPRVSPDGNFLLFTACDFGSFPIWHKEADLNLFNLKTKKYMNMDKVNSPDVDSYHSWSSNSRWIVYSSRRGDGLYSRMYIAHVDEDGETGKAFMLPQKDPDFYDAFMKSYNIPELVKGEIKADSYLISRKVKNASGLKVRYKNNN